jgi:hypothetical protein
MNLINSGSLLFQVEIPSVQYLLANNDPNPNNATFSSTSGKLTIPRLLVGNDVYSLVLNLISPTAYIFQVDAASLRLLSAGGEPAATGSGTILNNFLHIWTQWLTLPDNFSP